MAEYVIQTENLNFSYHKTKKTIDELSLRVPEGSIYGFLGPNGAGKSTTMRLLTGILPDEANAIHLFGKPLNSQIPEVFRKIGAIVESPALYLHLTGYENLQYIAGIRGIKPNRIPEILNLVGLEEAGRQKAKRYSLGMKQRLAIGMALMDNPPLLLLDEPVNGLDPSGIIEFRKMLIRLNQEQGTSIFISSHLLSEIEKLCTHIGIISKGKLRFEGTMGELETRFGQCRVSLRLGQPEKWLTLLAQKYQAQFSDSSSKIELVLQTREDIPALISQLTQQGASVYEVNILESLEDRFMTVTQS